MKLLTIGDTLNRKVSSSQSSEDISALLQVIRGPDECVKFAAALRVDKNDLFKVVEALRTIRNKMFHMEDYTSIPANDLFDAALKLINFFQPGIDVVYVENITALRLQMEKHKTFKKVREKQLGWQHAPKVVSK
jgi:hypothetical protein